jgi:hypothetical protein
MYYSANKFDLAGHAHGVGFWQLDSNNIVSDRSHDGGQKGQKAGGMETHGDTLR